VRESKTLLPLRSFARTRCGRVLENAPEEFRYSSAFPGYELDASAQALKPQI